MFLPGGEEPAGRGEGLWCERRGAVSSLYLSLSRSQGGTRGGRPPGRSSCCCCCCCRRRGRGGDERRGAGRGGAGRAQPAAGAAPSGRAAGTPSRPAERLLRLAAREGPALSTEHAQCHYPFPPPPPPRPVNLSVRVGVFADQLRLDGDCLRGGGWAREYTTRIY